MPPRHLLDKRRLDRTRRLVAALAALTLGLAGLLIVVAAPANAATRGFTPPVFSANTTGDVLIRGNSLETCPPGSVQADGSVTCAAVQAGATQENNKYKMAYVDSDGTTGIGATTFDSSSATVTVPAGATVLYAGLSWAANVAAGSLSGYPALTGVAAPDATAKGTALFQAPGATSYTSVTSTTTDFTSPQYQAYADVTSTVQAAGSGVYTVANVQAGTGGGNYAGWSLAVAFRDPTMPSRNLVVFTGYNTVSSATPTLDIPVSGFTTPPTGQVKTTIGVVAYEGDKGEIGDGLSVGGTALSNSLNPVNDIFNSTISDLNVAVSDRTPNYVNTLGLDIDRFDATGVLANGSTSTTIHLTTSGETYYPGMITFATDLLASALSATKTATDVNGGTLARGDVLNYSVTVSNAGGNGAVATVLTDTVPANTTYVDGSLVVGGTAVSDASGDDTGEVSAGNITARLGTGATATAGGLLAPAATSTVSFSVTVNPTVADGTSIANTASFSSNDQLTGVGTAGASNRVTNSVVVPPVLSGSLLSPGEVGATYSSGLTVTSGTGTGPFVWSISAGTLPAGLGISASTGLITGTPTAAGTSSFTVRAVDANSRAATSAQSITVIAGPVVAFTPPSGEAGAAYSAQPTASGGTSPYMWSVSTGTLPAGLSINASTGLISGTPTTAGTTGITVRAVDAKSVGATKAVSIVIIAGPTVTFTPPAGEVTIAYSAQPTVSGGTAAYTWSVSVGVLPAGLSINPSTGLISGSPTAAGTTNITVQAVDAKSVTATAAVSIVIAAVPSITFTPPAGEVGGAYSAQPTLSGGTGPYTWSVTGTLPAGLTIDGSTGLISGTPTATGTTNFTVRTVDANNVNATKAVSIVIGPGPAVTFTPPTGEATVPYSAQPTVSGGTGPFTWSVSTGTLPAGLSINPSTGLISGTPTAAGSTTVTVQATDTNNVSATNAVTIVIGAAPALTFAAPPAGELAIAYTDQLTFTGGVGPFTWSVSAGMLPAGLSLDASTGLLSGTPTAPGTSSFTVKIVDSNGALDTRAVTLVIARTTTTISVSAPASVRFGSAVTLSAAVSPTAAGGTVTFTDVPATGPQSGTTVTIGTGTLSAGAASVSVTLPAFGVNTITAHYAGGSTYAAADSSTTQVEVSAYAGEVIVTEFRPSGPAGATDSYVELLNTGATVPLAGIVVSTSSGSTSTLPLNAGFLGTGRSYLVTGSGFSLGAVATSDYSTTLGTGGIKVVAPDTALTRTDAVGPGTGYHLGTGLPALTGTPTAQYAWVRHELAGAAVNTSDNATDFTLVSTSTAPVGGIQPTLGSPSPTGTADPYQTNAAMTSTLFNTNFAANVSPNRIITTGPPRQLVIQRSITNTGTATITAAKVRITALSELHGPPEPGVTTQPSTVANLRAVNPVAAPGSAQPNGSPALKLTLDAPITDALGGGLNSTLTLPLPDGGLTPGDSIRVAFTFDIDTSGTFWFGYDIDATTSATPAARTTNRTSNRTSNPTANRTASRATHVTPRTTRQLTPTDSGRIS